MLSDFDREEKPRTGCRNIEAGRILRSDLCLYETGGRGKDHVRRRRGHEDEVDFLAGNPGLFHGCEGRLCPHVAGVFVGGGDPPFLDPGTAGDPLVVGIDQLGEVIIGQPSLRNVTARADDRDSALRLSGARTRAVRAFHYNGGLPRRYED